MAERRSRLDQPREQSTPWVRRPRGMNREAFGVLSEKFARFMGTPQFILWMTVFVAAWLIWNTWGPKGMQFDPRDLNYTLLTLILSLQAHAYAAETDPAVDRHPGRVNLDIENGIGPSGIGDEPAGDVLGAPHVAALLDQRGVERGTDGDGEVDHFEAWSPAAVADAMRAGRFTHEACWVLAQVLATLDTPVLA